MRTKEPVILDGGLSTALEQQGAVLDSSLWTARLLAESPDMIADAHRAYFRAGAQVATTATYQASVTGFTGIGLDESAAAALMQQAVRIARDVRDEFADVDARDLLVAASVGPYGATLADGSEYRGRYELTPAQLEDFHAPRLELLVESGADLIAVETIPDLEEARVIARLLEQFDVPAWLTYSIQGGSTSAGQPLREAFEVVAGSPAIVATGVNCCQQGDVLDAVTTAVEVTGLPAIAYPNRGGVWDAATKTWSTGAPVDFELVDRWVQAGAGWVGGCCGLSPADIRLLADHLTA